MDTTSVTALTFATTGAAKPVFTAVEEVPHMMRATYQGTVLAQTPRTVRIEGAHYFPADSVRWDLLADSSTKTLCPWKGIAHYFNLVRGDQPDIADLDLAWRYRKPSPLSRMIKNHVAFSPQVRVDGEQEGPGTLRRLRDRITGTSTARP